MKEIQVATDFYDEVVVSKRFYEARQIQSLMAYCRSLGAGTIQWIMDDIWTLYESYPGGIDLLKTAVDAAHAEGLRFHVVYKPFEGCLAHMELPHTMPRPGAPAQPVVWEDLRSLIPIVRPFVAAHPELCMKRWPGDEDPGGHVQAIRLIKNDNEPANIDPNDISIWISNANGRFTRYTGSFQLEESSSWRRVFPLGRTCRVVTLSGLDIPMEQRYIEVRFADGAFGGNPFRNEYEHIVELVNDRGNVIPSTPAIAKPLRDHYVRALAQPHMSQLVRYAHDPDVRAFLSDDNAITEHASEMRAYGRVASSREYAIDQTQHLSVVRGKIPHLCGMLNPVYPQVREHWLAAVRFCIERGVDGVDFRASQHGRLQENWAYGFNEPVLEALDGERDMAGARRIIGDAYTQFLREARDLLHAHDKQIGVHLLTNFLRPRDEPGEHPHEALDFQWQTWVSEIADFATIRGAMGLREESLRYTVDCFADACRAADIPVTYQSNRRIYVNKPDPLHLETDRLQYLAYEMDYALKHPGITGYQFYETASFTHLDEAGELHGSDELRALARHYGFQQPEEQPM